MKKYNISKPEKYMKDGVEKTYWANIGTMTEFTKTDGTISRIMEIPAISLKANIFPVEPKANAKVNADPKDLPPMEVNPDDIPF